jgi:hypothetical protein
MRALRVHGESCNVLLPQTRCLLQVHIDLPKVPEVAATCADLHRSDMQPAGCCPTSLKACTALHCTALHTAHCTLHTAHCTLHTALHTAHCTLHTAHCTALHTAHCTLHTALHCTALPAPVSCINTHQDSDDDPVPGKPTWKHMCDYQPAVHLHIPMTCIRERRLPQGFSEPRGWLTVLHCALLHVSCLQEGPRPHQCAIL